MPPTIYQCLHAVTSNQRPFGVLPVNRLMSFRLPATAVTILSPTNKVWEVGRAGGCASGEVGGGGVGERGPPPNRAPPPRLCTAGARAFPPLPSRRRPPPVPSGQLFRARAGRWWRVRCSGLAQIESSTTINHCLNFFQFGPPAHQLTILPRFASPVYWSSQHIIDARPMNVGLTHNMTFV